MKMPIVSLNNMAMNESVAATCCYKQDQLNGYYFETVLSGGTLTNVVSTNKNPIVDESWFAINGDYAQAHQDYDLVYYNGKPGIMVHTPFVGPEFVELKATDKLAGWEYCDHTQSNCSYWHKTSTPEIVYSHVGSTVAHTAGGTKWADAHKAQRFNS